MNSRIVHKIQIIMHKRIVITTFLLLVTVGLLPAQDFKKAVADKLYPNPQISFNTPTLSIDENRFATYNEIITWLESRASDSRMTLSFIGVSEGGYRVPMVKLSNGNDSKKLKVWFQGLIHGNEPGGAEGLFSTIDYVLGTKEGSRLLDKMDIHILPVANIDGYLSFQRVSARGLDLNRDQTKFADPQSIIIKKAFIEANPDVAMDFHEYDPYRTQPFVEGKGAVSYYDVLFLPTGYPNVRKELRQASIDLFQNKCEKVLDEYGYSHFGYYTVDKSVEEPTLVLNAKSPQSSSTSYALSNAISFFVELRGIGLGRLSLERRAHCSFIVARSVLEQAYNNSGTIKKLVRQSNRLTVKGKEPVTVLFHSKEKRMTVTWLDMNSVEPVQVENIRVLDALEPQIEMQRERPEAYIIEQSEQKAVENLRILGVEVTQLEKDTELEVESYKVTEYSTDNKKWEDIHKQNVRTELFKEKRVFSKGTFVVNTHQENANFAVSVLEPEAANGFVAFCVIGTGQGEVLKVHRLNRK